MRWAYICLLVSVACSVFADEPAPAKKDLDALQGTWTVESLEYDGQNETDMFKLALVFKGAVLTVEGDGEVRKGYGKIRVKLDPSTKPKCVDFSIAAGTQQGSVLEGVYELKGDELRLCVRVLGKERPSEFKSSSGSGIALLRLKRQK
jgi:uncharacterized protein (TIGR03067 family)